MNRPEKLKLFILMLALICAIAVGAHAQEPDQLYRVDEIPIEDLSEILPARNVQGPLVYEFLPGNRLFAVTDRLNLIDLDAMKRIAEAPLPDSAPALDSEFVFRTDRIQESDNGLFWFIYGFADGNIVQLGYQFDNDLKLIREFDMIPYTGHTSETFMDISRDGSELFYIRDMEELWRENLDTGEKARYLKTEMGFNMEINSLINLRLIDNGKSVLFVGHKLIEPENSDSEGIPTHLVFGTLSPNGENLAIDDGSEYNVPIDANTLTSFMHTPQTSSIALIVPTALSEPETIKTVYALDVAAKHVVEIPLQAPLEDERAKLSENGKYLATAVCESRDDGTFALVPRLYGTEKGSLLATYEFPALSECTNAAVGVSEADGLISVVYQDGQAVRLVRTPIEK